MNEIEDYIILFEDSTYLLSVEVRKYIAMGYVPIGGVAIRGYETAADSLYQAMVKYKK